MRPIDYGKAALLALLVMVINVGVSFLALAVYSYGIDPGHDGAYYEMKAGEIAPWSSVIAGVPIFFGAAFFSARRRPERNAIAFAVTFFAIYAAIDFSIIVAAGAIALSTATKLAAAFAGAALATNGKRRA